MKNKMLIAEDLDTDGILGTRICYNKKINYMIKTLHVIVDKVKCTEDDVDILVDYLDEDVHDKEKKKKKVEFQKN